MSTTRILTGSELMRHIEHDWSALSTLLSDLSTAQWTQIKNADGWTIQDHIAHITAWENSVIAFLTDVSPHQVLGVSTAMFLNRDLDAINQIIFQKHQAQPLEQVQERFHKTHAELVGLLGRLSDSDLVLPMSHYLPYELDEDPRYPVIDLIYVNTAHHYRKHQPWIEEMLATGTST